MSAKNNGWALALMKLVFQNVAVPLIGDAPGILGSTSAGSLYLAAHTADPLLDGDQESNEADFGGYLRVAVLRSSLKWTCDLLDAELGPARAINLANITFPTCTSGTATVTHFSVGASSSGPGLILYSGALAEPRNVSAGIRLIIEPGDLVLTEF